MLYNYLTEEDLELLIRLVQEDSVQYEGVIKDYELEMLEQHVLLIRRLKIMKQDRYGK